MGLVLVVKTHIRDRIVALGFMTVCGRSNINEMDGATRKLAGVHKNFDPHEFNERFFLKISVKFAFDKELLEKIGWETSKTFQNCVVNIEF